MKYPFRHSTDRELLSGEPRLGATLANGGVNFAIASRDAREVFLLLFDKLGEKPTDTIALTHRTGDIWHVFVAGVKAGQIYAYRVGGKYDPAQGLYFNPCKALVDPYAKAVIPHSCSEHELLDGSNHKDNAVCSYKGVVIDDDFDWQAVQKPQVPREDMVIYETHLKGFTAHRSSGVTAPGTYLGFIEKIPYLKDLGITTVELLPVHSFHHREALLRNKTSEYWGYNTIGFFSPEFSYSSGSDLSAAVREFKTWYGNYRGRDELILDVVYNHTESLVVEAHCLSWYR